MRCVTHPPLPCRPSSCGSRWTRCAPAACPISPFMPDAHRAAVREAPLETGLEEDSVRDSSASGLLLHQAGAPAPPTPHLGLAARAPLSPPRAGPRSGPLVHEPMKTASIARPSELACRCEASVTRARPADRRGCAPIGATWPDSCPGHHRLEFAGVRARLRHRTAHPDRLGSVSSIDRPYPSFLFFGNTAVEEIGKNRIRQARPSQRARRLYRHVQRGEALLDRHGADRGRQRIRRGSRPRRRPRSCDDRRITSLALTPAGRTAHRRLGCAWSVCGRPAKRLVASTCSFSDWPIPKASAPSAPWVDVWLSRRPGRSPAA